MKQNFLAQEKQYQYKEQDPHYMGQPLEKEHAQGPTDYRRCRDVLFLILYLAFLAGMIVVAVYAFKTGNPQLLAAPFDSTGMQCGYAKGYQNFPYAYFNINNPSQFACIDKCPTSASTTSASNCINGGVTFSCSNYGSYQTFRFVSICYPTSSTIAAKVKIGMDFFQESISDLKATWPISLTVAFLALFLSLILMIFFQFCAGCMVISVIIIYLAILVAFGLLAYFTSDKKINFPGLDDIKYSEYLKIIAYVSWAVAAISLIIILCLFKKIRIAVTILSITAQFVRQKCQTIIVPFIMFIAIVIFFAWWILVSIFLFSSGTVTQCNGSPYACINWNIGVKRCLLYYFIGLFWNSEIAIGMCQFVLASTASMWYFSHLNGKDTDNPICRSFWRGIIYHFGSIALGGLILCILVMLQIFFEFLHWSAKNKTISSDPITNACFRCCISYLRCFLACFQRFIRFISKNAFIMIAITGEGFCTAAHQAFYLIVRSAAEYTITHGAGHLIVLFGKLLITVLTTIVGYIFITQISYFSDNIFSPIMPTIIFVVISFVISSLFMDVYGIGADTILLCYCLELDINKGTKACPEELKHSLSAYHS